MTYSIDINCWVKTFSLSQPANTIDGGPGEELEATVQTVPGANPKNDKFIVLKTDQWAIDVDEIDAFADWLKSICK